MIRLNERCIRSYYVLLVLVLLLPVNCGASFNIVDYGAKGDGVTLNTASINGAIKAAVNAGGGDVFVPKGDFLTGAFNLSSHVYLVLDSGAILRASDNPQDYICLPTPIFDVTVDLEYTGIRGSGIIRGGANDPLDI